MERLTALVNDKMATFDKEWLPFKTFVKRDRLNMDSSRAVPNRLRLGHLDGVSSSASNSEDEADG